MIPKWVDEIPTLVIWCLLGYIGMGIVYATIAGIIAFGVVIGLGAGCQACGFDLFAWIGGGLE